MSSNSIKVNTKDVKDVVILASVLTFFSVVIKTVTKDTENSTQKVNSDF